MKKTLGTLISEARKQKGMTQLELSQKMGVTDKAISKWERDLSCPDIHSLPLLAEALDLSLEELMQGSGGEKSAGAAPGQLLSTIFKGVALAMGVAAAALTALDAVSLKDAVGLLGIGLACLSLALLREQD